MALYAKTVIFQLLYFGLINIVYAQGNMDSLSKNDNLSIQGLDIFNKLTTLRPIKEFAEVQKYLDRKDYTKVSNILDQITLLKKSEFSSPRRYNFVMGVAFYLKAEIASQRDSLPAALNYYRDAITFGNAIAASKAVDILNMVLLHTDPKSEAYKQLSKELRLLLIMGAELEVPSCMESLYQYFQQHDDPDAGDYWFFMRRFSDSVIRQYEVFKVYETNFSSEDKSNFLRVFNKYSDIKDTVYRRTAGLPGRSIMTNLYIETLLHRDLLLWWGGFFDDNRKKEPDNLKDGFEFFKKRVFSFSPFIKEYAIINSRFKSSIPDHIELTNKQMVENILPGDVLMINCGVLTHYATVFSIDKENKKFYFIDPLEDFWKPSHNNCVTTFHIYPYDYTRELVEIGFKDVENMIVADFTMRDNEEVYSELKKRLHPKEN
jgi:hypothetical protein